MKMMYLFLMLVAGTISLSAYAGSDFNHNEIRQLVQQGKILSLDTLLKKHDKILLGHMLDLEVEKEHGLIIYELEFLQQNGHVYEYKIDALSGEILEMEIEK